MLEVAQLLSLSFFWTNECHESHNSCILHIFSTSLVNLLCLVSQMVTKLARPILEPRCVFSPDTNLPLFISFHCHMQFAPFQYFVHFLKWFLQCSVPCPHLGWSYRSSSSPIRFLYMFLNILLLWGLMHSVHRQQYKERLLNYPKKSQKCALRDVVGVWD